MVKVTFINPDNMEEEQGFLIWQRGFQAKVKSSSSSKTYILDIDDVWSM